MEIKVKNKTHFVHPFFPFFYFPFVHTTADSLSQITHKEDARGVKTLSRNRKSPKEKKEPRTRIMEGEERKSSPLSPRHPRFVMRSKFRPTHSSGVPGMNMKFDTKYYYNVPGITRGKK